MSAAAETVSPSGNSTSKPKVLIVTGPTAVGKTAISLSLAERLNGEIISADSVQVYKGLDIGSDKISVEERRGISHHLLDVFDPDNDFSAGEFYHLARAITTDILNRGKTPIVVGGTGFYLRWYILGKPSTPTASKESEAAAQAKLEAAWAAAETQTGRPLTDSEKWQAGVQVVADLGDQESADRLSKESNNYYRLTRVVDILLQAPGRTLAELNLDEAAPLDYDFRCFYLIRPREELYRRIDSRVEDMVGGGVIEETSRELVQKGLKANTNCATRAIGYRQVLDFLEKAQVHGPESIDDKGIIELARSIQNQSRKLCHRQMNWFRDDPLFKWIDARDQDAARESILKMWEESDHQGGCEEFNGGRLTDEQKKQMKRYVTKFEKLKVGNELVKKALAEAVTAVEMAAAVGGGSEGNGAAESEETEAGPAIKRVKS